LTSSRATWTCGRSSPRRPRGQIIDLDPDLLTHLIRGLVWLSGLQIAHASDPGGAAIDQVLGLLETIDRALPVTSAFVGEHLGGDERGTAAVAPPPSP
jgi:hypothetical protein